MPASKGYQEALKAAIMELGEDPDNFGWQHLVRSEEAAKAEKVGIPPREYLDFTEWAIGEGDHDDAMMQDTAQRLRGQGRFVGGTSRTVAEGNPMRTHKSKGITISGNPEEVTLHEGLSAMADWLDYEAEVVEEAADDLEALGDDDLAEKAHDQAEAMEEAADQVEEAADEAREAAAEAFNEEGEPASEIAAEDSPEGEVVGGNPSPHHGSGSQGRGAEAGVISGNPIGADTEVEWAERFEAALREEGYSIADTVDVLSEEDMNRLANVFTPKQAARAAAAVIEGETLNTLEKGNPGSPPVPVGGNPDPNADPQGAPPTSNSPNQGGNMDSPPDLDHWYNRPLIGRQ